MAGGDADDDAGWEAPRTLSLEDRQVFLDVNFALFGAEPAPIKVSRYELGERIGAGGLGVVYRARDPELDRDVAIKLVRLDLSPKATRSQARLAREAQAMARLEHPNVVSVFDVGEYDFRNLGAPDEVDGEVASSGLFIAMALVEGVTLSRWLATSHDWRAVVDVFVQAGRGLIAAHDGGLVHRDFKPANVIVGPSPHPVVQVLDFGLSSAAGDANASGGNPSAADSALGPETLATGMVMGTPFYMSPEQLRGEPTDARTDQYSFCLALFEALYGGLAQLDRDALTRMKLAGEFPAAGHTDVPARVHAALLRGMRPDAADRHDSMAALLSLLVTKERRRHAVVGTLVTGVGAAAVLIGLPDNARSADDQCPQLDAEVRQAWTVDRRAAVGRALGPSIGSEVPDELLGRLEARSDELAAAVEAACPAGTRRATDATLQCIRRASRELSAAAAVLEQADRDIALAASTVIDRLTPASGCEHAQRDTALFPSDPHVAAAAERVRGKLARAAALRTAGRPAEALALVDEAAAQAEPLALVALDAEVAFGRGQALDGLGRYDEAAAELRHAALDGEATLHDELAAAAAVQMVRALGVRSDRYADAHAWARRARAALDRVGAGTLLEGHLASAIGNVHKNEGKYEASLSAHRRGVEAFEQALGPHAATTLGAYADVANLLMHLGRYEESVTQHREVLAAQLRVLDPEHPDVARAHHDLANPLAELGQLDEAQVHYSEALRIYTAALSDAHPDVAMAHHGLAGVYVRREEPAAALEHFEIALAMRERTLGADNELTCTTLSMIAVSHHKLRNDEQADAGFRRTLDCFGGIDGGRSATATILANYGNFLIDVRRLDRAVEVLERGLEVASAVFAEPHPMHVTLGFNLGTALQERGQREPARLHYREASQIAAKLFAPDHPFRRALATRGEQFDEVW